MLFCLFFVFLELISNFIGGGILENPIIYTKSKKNWDYGLLMNIAAGKSSDILSNRITVKKKLYTLTDVPILLLEVNTEDTIEVRFYSSDTENEAYRVGQRRCKGRVQDIRRANDEADDGFIITIDRSKEKRGDVCDVVVDRYYLEYINAKAIYIYVYKSATSREYITHKVSVENWLSARTYIDKLVTDKESDPEDTLLEFRENDYVEIEYINNVHESTTTAYTIESVDTTKICGRIRSVSLISVQVAVLDWGDTTGHVRPSDLQTAGSSLTDTIELPMYEFELDTSDYHEYSTFTVQSYLIQSIVQIDPPKEVDLTDKIKDPKLLEAIRLELDINDSEIITQDLAESLENLDCSGRDITTLEGINIFPNIINLDCSHNKLIALDVSGLYSLETLVCSYNDITGLTFATQTNLEYVDCTYNGMKSPSDVVITGTHDHILNIDGTVLYTPQKVYVQDLFVDDTFRSEIYSLLGFKLYSLINTQDCESITEIILDGRHLRDEKDTITEDNKNTRTKVKSLQGIEYLVNLVKLVVPYNYISEIDLTKNTKLTYVDISYNKLVYNSTILNDNNVKLLNLNTLTNLEYFDCRYNYIQDENYIRLPKAILNEAGEMVEGIETFLFYPQIEDITYKFVDEYFELAIRELLDLHFNDMILKSDLVGITRLDVSSKKIKNLSGIEYFVDLEVLYCQDNNISSIFFSSDSTSNDQEVCPNLSWLECQDNDITEVTLLNLGKLDYLDCSNNKISKLSIINCFGLQKINCSYNLLTFLDITGSSTVGNNKYEELLELDCSHNRLVSINLSTFPNLNNLYCNNNDLDYMDIGLCKDIRNLNCSHNRIDTLILTNCTRLIELRASNNKLIELDVGMCKVLSLVDVTYNYIPEKSHVTNITSGCSLLYDPQMKNITRLFDSNLLPIMIKELGIEGSEIWNYDCLFLTKLDIQSKRISKLDGLEYCTNLEELNCNHNLLQNIDISTFKKLEVLYCDNNNITSINMGNITELVTLCCRQNKISELDLSYVSKLIELDCSDNKLTELTVNNLTVLEILMCDNNQLIDITIDNDSLTYLDCSYNSLRTLDVSSSILLQEIYCQHNLLDTFDPRGRIALYTLDCSNNYLQKLNVTSCLVLRWLDCSHNILTELDLSNRQKMEYLDCRYNAIPSRSNVNTAGLTMLKTFLFDPQITEVTDQFEDLNFRQVVRELLGLTIDDPIMYSSCSHITELDISNKDIHSLKGIEYFVNLETLDCSRNYLQSIDVSMLQLLTSLKCTYNYMTDLNDIKRIKTILTDDNIDFTPQYKIINDYFTDPVFASYIRSKLDFTPNNNILDQECLKITEVDVHDMGIHKLDGIEWLINITILNCSRNFIENINVSSNINLMELDCRFNHIQDIDITKCEGIDKLWCSHNNMEDDTHVKRLKDENSEILSTFQFEPQNIIINDEFHDYLFKSKIIGMNPFEHNEVLTDYVVSMITELDLNGKDIEEEYKYKNLDGINYFVKLERLDCSYNMLERLDVSGCVSLRELNCSHNWLYDQYLVLHSHTDGCKVGDNIDNCTCKLEKLDCSYNYLREVVASYFRHLREIDCSYNSSSLDTLNILECPNLITVNCSHNKIISLDMTGDISLKTLNCSFNKIYRLVIADCVNMDTLLCNNNSLTTLDVSPCKSLVFLHCYYNRITFLDVTTNDNLTQLDCHNNQLIQLEIHGNRSLQYVYCFYNNLIGLDVAGCTSIEFLNCSYNAIRYITQVTNRPNTLIEDENFIYAPQNSYQ